MHRRADAGGPYFESDDEDEPNPTAGSESGRVWLCFPRATYVGARWPVAEIAVCIAARSAARRQAARSRAAAGIVVGVLALLAWVLLVIAAISALNDFFT